MSGEIIMCANTCFDRDEEKNVTLKLRETEKKIILCGYEIETLAVFAKWESNLWGVLACANGSR